MKQRVIYRPYVIFAVLTVLIVAVLTAGSLLVLARLHRQAAHRTAARDVLDQGRLIAAHLANQPVVTTSDAGSDDWLDFSKRIESLTAIIDGLKYVSGSHS